MTDNFFNTPSNSNEAPLTSAKSDAFPDLLKSVFNLIVAERDLEDTSYSQDPAYSAWLRDAELAHESLTGSLCHFHKLPIHSAADQPLQLMASLIDGMLGHEEPGGARQLQLRMEVAFFTKFQISGIGSTAMHRNGMLLQARHLVSALAALPLFDGTAESPDDDLDVGDVATF